MIKKIMKAEYSVVCDTCGDETLGDSSAQKEIAEAKKAGWKLIPRCFEQDIAVCPKCQLKEQSHE